MSSLRDRKRLGQVAPPLGSALFRPFTFHLSPFTFHLSPFTLLALRPCVRHLVVSIRVHSRPLFASLRVHSRFQKQVRQQFLARIDSIAAEIRYTGFTQNIFIDTEPPRKTFRVAS
jgi:hypothetical protein